MADIPFAVDIAQPDPETGGSIMWHVRGSTIDAFVRNLQDLTARVPSVSYVVAHNTAQLRNELTHEPQRRQATAEQRVEQRVERGEPTPASSVEPVCPTHSRALWSSKFTGLYCPEPGADSKYCKWQHRCSAACTHQPRAA